MDISTLLQPVSQEEPSGPDSDDFKSQPELYNSAAKLEAMSTGEFRDGIIQPPRWPAIQEEAVKLAARVKHLRTAFLLTESACINEGYPGFRDGLCLIREWCSSFWDSLYPKEERPTFLEGLGHPSFLVKPRNIILASFKGVHYSFADFERAKDVSSDSQNQEESNEARLIFGVFQNSSVERHRENLAAVREALDHTRAIEEIFDLNNTSVDLSGLRDLLSMVIKILEPMAKDNEPATDSESFEIVEGAENIPGNLKLSGAISSRQVAVELLEKAAKFFELTEPSSPVPLLIRRAQSCVGKNFMELLGELAIDRSQAEVILKSNVSSSID